MMVHACITSDSMAQPSCRILMRACAHPTWHSRYSIFHHSFKNQSTSFRYYFCTMTRWPSRHELMHASPFRFELTRILLSPIACCSSSLELLMFPPAIRTCPLFLGAYMHHMPPPYSPAANDASSIAVLHSSTVMRMHLSCLYRGQGGQPVVAAGARVVAGAEIFKESSVSYAIEQAPGAREDDGGGGAVVEAVEPQVEGSADELHHLSSVAWVLHMHACIIFHPRHVYTEACCT